MRLVRNEIQAPQKLVAPEGRKKPAFMVLLAGLMVLAAGVALFFLAYIMRNYIKENWTISFQLLQTYGLMVAFVGVFFIYLLAARRLIFRYSIPPTIN